MKKERNPIEVMFWVFVFIFAVALFGTIGMEFHRVSTTNCPLCGNPLVTGTSVRIGDVEYHQNCVNSEFNQILMEGGKGN